MTRLVLKFGGTSVADTGRIASVASRIKQEWDAGHDLAVVVSAMAGETDRLIALAREIAPLSNGADYDAIVSSGEQVTAGLLALALEKLGVPARSWQGWQIPIYTDGVHGAASVLSVEPAAIAEDFKQRRVAVVAGFQGIGPDGRITTLGRGGSDTTAVALAAALKAERCDIYTDVDGIYTADPRLVPQAAKLSQISYEQMLEMASLGAKVMQTRSVELAMVHGVRTQVRSTFTGAPGTLICGEDEIVERKLVAGVAHSRDEAKISLLKVADKPGVAAAIFGPLADAGINVDMIVQNVSEDGRTIDLTFTVIKADFERALQAIERCAAKIGYRKIVSDADIAKVSVIGHGIRTHAGVAQILFKTLAEKNIHVQVISTSEIKVSVLIAAKYLETAVRALHAAYGLGG